VTAAAAAPRLEIVAGRADDIRAEIAVVVTLPEAAAARPAVSGTFVGPSRGRETTLPTTVTLAPVAAALPPHAAAAKAVFTEPAYWSPALPNLYRLRLRVDGTGGEPAVIDRLVGLRRLGVRGRSLWLEGRRWVPRGAAVADDAFAAATFRRQAATAEIIEPSPDTCSQADAAGVAILARLAGGADAAAAAERVAGWALHPSVVLVALPRTLAAGEVAAVAAAVRRARGTTLLAVEVDGTLPPPAAAGPLHAVWGDPGAAGRGGLADCVILDLPADGPPHEGWRSWPFTIPLIARRAVTGAAAAVGAGGDDVVADLRRECDRLQGALAAWGVAGGDTTPPRDWAGYVVVPAAHATAVSPPSPPA